MKTNSTKTIKQIIKLAFIVLVTIPLISFILRLKYINNKILAIIFYGDLLIGWILIAIIPQFVLEVSQSIFFKNKKREIRKSDIWFNRIMAIIWIIICIKKIKDIIDV